MIRYVIRDGEGYWFCGYENGEAVFNSLVIDESEIMFFDDIAAAQRERDALAQMSGDTAMAVHTEMIR